jgi:hypothetical protein
MSDNLQELLALAVVFAVGAAAAWRWWQKRQAGHVACSNCGPATKAPPNEQVLQFHRRRP